MLTRLACALWIGLTAMTQGFTAYAGDRFSTERVEVEIAGGYRIPYSYILRIAPEINGLPGHQLVTMRALWPGLEPPSEENQHVWQHRIPERQIYFAIRKRPREGYRALRGAIQFGLLDESPEPGPFGLMRYAKDWRRRFVPVSTDYLTPLGEPLALKCDDATTESVKKNFDFEPLCIVQYPLEDGAGLSYRFFMKNLEHWREIDRAIRELVTSFRR